jgi:hypothetical protein
MSTSYSTVTATARLNAVIDKIDAGGSGAHGSLILGTSALSGITGILASIPLDFPSATVTGRVLTFAGVPIDTTASANGVAAKAEIRDGLSGNTIVSGLTIGLTGSGANIIMDTTAITTSRPIRLVSATITHP